MEVVQEGNGITYKYKCFNCGAELVYRNSDIHRNPVANRAVSRHGFRGYTGEVRCPKCGTFLPHYEQNKVTEQ